MTEEKRIILDKIDRLLNKRKSELLKELSYFTEDKFQNTFKNI